MLIHCQNEQYLWEAQTATKNSLGNKPVRLCGLFKCTCWHVLPAIEDESPVIILVSFTYFWFSYLSLSRCMSWATSKPRVTSVTWQAGYASLSKNSTDNEERSGRLPFMVTCKCVTHHDWSQPYARWGQVDVDVQHTHKKWSLTDSSVAVSGTEHTNKVFLVYKRESHNQSGFRLKWFTTR